VLAERAAWDYVDSHGDVGLTVVNPTGIFGPQVSDRPSGSLGMVQNMLSGRMPVVPLMYFGVVDVRDVVDLHLRAMVHPKAARERFLAVGGISISLFGMAQILREHDPAAAAGLPAKEMTIEQVREAARTEPALRDAAARQGRIPVISNAKARSSWAGGPGTSSRRSWRPRAACSFRAWVSRAAGDPPGPVPAGVLPERALCFDATTGRSTSRRSRSRCCTTRNPVQKGSLSQERFRKLSENMRRLSGPRALKYGEAPPNTSDFRPPHVRDWP
jgi:hypothetical protein